MSNNDFETFTKTRWEWNEETDEWKQVEETFGREVTGEWRRDENGEWHGWHNFTSWRRDENGNFVEGGW